MVLRPRGRGTRSKHGLGLQARNASRLTKNGRVGIQYITKAEGAALLDRQAEKYLGMSGEQFKRQYREGTIENPDHSDVIRVSMILPLAGE